MFFFLRKEVRKEYLFFLFFTGSTSSRDLRRFFRGRRFGFFQQSDLSILLRGKTDWPVRGSRIRLPNFPRLRWFGKRFPRRLSERYVFRSTGTCVQRRRTRRLRARERMVDAISRNESYSILYSFVFSSLSTNIFRYYLNELPFSVEVMEESRARAEEKEEIPSVLPLLLQWRNQRLKLVFYFTRKCEIRNVTMDSFVYRIIDLQKIRRIIIVILSYPNTALIKYLLKIEKRNEKIDSVLLSFKKSVLNRYVVEINRDFWSR